MLGFATKNPAMILSTVYLNDNPRRRRRRRRSPPAKPKPVRRINDLKKSDPNADQEAMFANLCILEWQTQGEILNECIQTMPNEAIQSLQTMVKHEQTLPRPPYKRHDSMKMMTLLGLSTHDKINMITRFAKQAYDDELKRLDALMESIVPSPCCVIL